MLEFVAQVAQESTERGLDPNIVKPGWVALGIVALMGVALFLLARSFAKQSRRAKETLAPEQD